MNDSDEQKAAGGKSTAATFTIDDREIDIREGTRERFPAAFSAT
jgi:hypothetical protein